jgi:hypothetical protein
LFGYLADVRVAWRRQKQPLLRHLQYAFPLNFTPAVINRPALSKPREKHIPPAPLHRATFVRTAKLLVSRFVIARFNRAILYSVSIALQTNQRYGLLDAPLKAGHDSGWGQAPAFTCFSASTRNS